MKSVPTEKRISIEKCKKALKTTGRNYTDEQLLQIREFLYQLAEIEYNAYIRKLEHETQSNNIHESFHR